MGINKYKYITYTCDICLENISERSMHQHRYETDEGEFPILIGGKQLHLSGYKYWLYKKPIVICQLCQKEIRKKVKEYEPNRMR
jgi:hypothetical protein